MGSTLITAVGPNGAIGAASIRLPSGVKYPLGGFIMAGTDYSAGRNRIYGLNDDAHAMVWAAGSVFNGFSVDLNGTTIYGQTKIPEKKNGWLAGIMQATDTMADVTHSPVLFGNYKSSLTAPNGLSFNVTSATQVSLRLSHDNGSGTQGSINHTLAGLSNLNLPQCYIGTWKSGVGYCISVPSLGKTTGYVASTGVRGIRTDLNLRVGANDVTPYGPGRYFLGVGGGDDTDGTAELDQPGQDALYAVLKKIANFNLGIDTSGWA